MGILMWASFLKKKIKKCAQIMTQIWLRGFNFFLYFKTRNLLFNGMISPLKLSGKKEEKERCGGEGDSQ